MNRQMLFGSCALDNPVLYTADPLLSFPGRGRGGEHSFGIDDRLYSQHILLLGGSGCGKTNVFLYAIDATKRGLTGDDVAVIFDTKGDFFKEFYRPGDLVLGNADWIVSQSFAWNVFEEVLADGWEDGKIDMNARELSSALFHGRGSSTQPFFCNAARDIFRAVLLHLIRQRSTRRRVSGAELNNRALVDFLHGSRPADYLKLFDLYPDLRYMQTYLGEGNNTQALGVLAELNAMVSELFVGIFADARADRSASMRTAVRARGGRTIFIEYDLSTGETLAPIYTLLLDQALKEALGSGVQNERQHLYVFADEFKLLPKLRHIDDALNFGRGLGVRVMAGIQNINQIRDIYGAEHGAVIAGGFGSLIAFHTNDHESREYITNRFGKNLMICDYTNRFANRNVQEQRTGNTVELWDQLQLGVGQAFVGLGDAPAFLFQFKEYGQNGGRR